MAHNKVYGVCENKCFVETMSKTQINDKIDSEVNEIKRDMDALVCTDVVEITSGSNYYIINTFGGDELSRPKFIINKTNASVNIKAKAEVFGTNVPYTLSYMHNGTLNSVDGYSSGQHGSDIMPTSTIDVTLETLTKGHRGLFQVLYIELKNDVQYN